MSKLIKVSSCGNCPHNGTCAAWTALTRKQRVTLTISNSIPHNFILKDCHLEEGLVNGKDLIVMPKELTAENGAKGLLSGEFKETVIMQCDNNDCDGGVDIELNEVCEYCTGAGEYSLKVPVSWTTIKEIYAKYAEYFQNKLTEQGK